MRTILSIIALFWMSFTYGQAEKPVSWTTAVEKVSGTEYNLIFKANIEKDWHLYSSTNPEGASLPIEFDGDAIGSAFELVGRPEESQTHKEFSKVWEKEEVFFVKNGTIIQRIKLKDSKTRIVQITLYAQACKTSCIQIEETFTFDLKKELF